ncbi:MAG: B12-binding domain-containing radical SAM protein, partial [Hyphomicrobiales bacterium]
MAGLNADSSRNVLCVFPRYTPSFGTFQHSYDLIGVQAFMPPQGILIVAAALPGHWSVRFVDENIRPASDEDFRWADAVFVSGMHIQRRQILDICARAHAHARTTVLGGPSVSASPEHYGAFDYLHVGEIGDATDDLVARLARDPSRPGEQVVLTTNERRALTEFPLPAYDLVELDRYMLGSVQFSSGCPYQCEFCDIPALYGRNPRLKTSQQILAELDKLVDNGVSGFVYFVDDNFIANRRAARELLPHIVEWQRRKGYPLSFSCEATLNIAKRPEILELMREAAFTSIFCGIETPDPAALKGISKDHNMAVPILEAVETLNRYGMEVVAGIILGLDDDTPDTGRRLLRFIDETRIPMLTINLLEALPRTPLWDRLEREGRLNHDGERESNVEFRLGYENVVATWRHCMAEAYRPERLFERFAHQVRHTYPNRVERPARGRLSWRNVGRGAAILTRVLREVGMRGDFRGEFWRFALPRLARGDIEAVIGVAIQAHHLIAFAGQASAGKQNASHYSPK